MEANQCIFCNLATGQMPSKKIYEDELITAILDIYPANPAHLLVMPKEHKSIISQLPKATVERFGVVAKKLSEVIFKSLRPDGMNIFIANGAIAGQKAPHFIMHIIPRFQGDGVNFEIAEKEAKKEDIDALCSKLRKDILNYFPEQKFEEEKEEKSVEEKLEEKKKGKNIDLDKITEMFG
jgi:histidine triad (HIT) family protein